MSDMCVISVGLVLDKTRGGTGPRHAGRHVAVDAVHATREISSGVATGLVSESGRHVHVRVHGVSRTTHVIFLAVGGFPLGNTVCTQWGGSDDRRRENS